MCMGDCSLGLCSQQPLWAVLNARLGAVANLGCCTDARCHDVLLLAAVTAIKQCIDVADPSPMSCHAWAQAHPCRACALHVMASRLRCEADVGRPILCSCAERYEQLCGLCPCSRCCACWGCWPVRPWVARAPPLMRSSRSWSRSMLCRALSRLACGCRQLMRALSKKLCCLSTTRISTLGTGQTFA